MSISLQTPTRLRRKEETVMLEGKTFLVTGSGKGIGSAIAVSAGKSGANVVVHYRSSEQSALRVFDEVQATGCRCILVKADLSKPEEAEKLYAEAKKAFNGVDVLVNNAALQNNVNFDAYTAEQIRGIFKVNLRGYLLMSQLVLPYMTANNWGRIINISSVHAKRPTNFDAGYSMTKGAIKMLTRELALETAMHHITVNALELGYVDIGVKSGNPPDVIKAAELNKQHLFDFKEIFSWGRYLVPENIGPIAMFLASDEAQYITGASLRVDDGAMLL